MLPELEAAEQLEAIEAASVPHYTPEGQKGVIARLKGVLKGNREEPVRAPTMHEALMATGRIAVREVPKETNGG